MHFPFATMTLYSVQAQRARSTLAVQVLASMQAAGIDAFIANSTTELAMCNLVGIPTVSVPIGFSPIPGSANSTRRNPLTLGFFGWPNGEPEVGRPHRFLPRHGHVLVITSLYRQQGDPSIAVPPFSLLGGVLHRVVSAGVQWRAQRLKLLLPTGG